MWQNIIRGDQFRGWKRHRGLAIRLTIGAILWLCGATAASAEQCLDLIRLSRVTSQQAASEASVEHDARTFCSEYASARANNRQMNAGASYGLFAGNVAGGIASQEATASKYCDSANNYGAKSDSYMQYAETISPGAYESYQSCLKLNNAGVTINFDPAAVKGDYLSLTVSSTVGGGGKMILIAATSRGADCNWLDAHVQNVTVDAAHRSATLDGQSQAALICTRQSISQQDIVRIWASNDPAVQFTYMWDKYTPENLPAGVLQSLQISTEKLLTSTKGQVTAFNAGSCPAGWLEYQPARGRFIRGIDSTGQSDPDGVRVLGSLQNDEFRLHTHARPRAVYEGHIQPNSGNVPPGNFYAYNFDSFSPAPSTGPAGGAETRPKNVALLYCERP